MPNAKIHPERLIHPAILTSHFDPLIFAWSKATYLDCSVCSREKTRLRSVNWNLKTISLEGAFSRMCNLTLSIFYRLHIFLALFSCVNGLNVVVAGGTGPVGRALLPRLSDHDVIVLTRCEHTTKLCDTFYCAFLIED